MPSRKEKECKEFKSLPLSCKGDARKMLKEEMGREEGNSRVPPVISPFSARWCAKIAFPLHPFSAPLYLCILRDFLFSLLLFLLLLLAHNFDHSIVRSFNDIEIQSGKQIFCIVSVIKRELENCFRKLFRNL